MSLNHVICLLLLVTILGASFGFASSRRELVTNGGFESGLDGWQTIVYDQIYGRVNITSGTSHSGTWSLRTYINPARGIPYTQKRGGGVTQTLSTDIEGLDMVLSFWVMPAVIGQNSYTNVRSLLHMELGDGRSVNLSYYVAWAPSALGEYLYNTSDSTIFFLPALLHQWSLVERGVKGDFESGFGTSSGVVLTKLWVAFEMTTVSHLTTPDAFWDDISVTAESRPLTPSPTETVTPTPRPTPSPSPTQTAPAVSPPATSPGQEEAGPGLLTQGYGVPLALLAVVVLVSILLALRVRSRKGLEAEIAKRYCLNCGAEIAVGSEYCERCGVRQ